MNRRQRLIVHKLADLYQLQSQSFGSAHRRFPILIKTIYSSFPNDDELLLLLNSSLTRDFGAPKSPAPIKRGNGGGSDVPTKQSKKYERRTKKKKQNSNKAHGQVMGRKGKLAR